MKHLSDIILIILTFFLTIGKWVLAVISVLNYSYGNYDIATYQILVVILLELNLKD